MAAGSKSLIPNPQKEQELLSAVREMEVTTPGDDLWYKTPRALSLRQCSSNQHQLKIITPSHVLRAGRCLSKARLFTLNHSLALTIQNKVRNGFHCQHRCCSHLPTLPRAHRCSLHPAVLGAGAKSKHLCDLEELCSHRQVCWLP